MRDVSEMVEIWVVYTYSVITAICNEYHCDQLFVDKES